jgi:hypothetical protein
MKSLAALTVAVLVIGACVDTRDEAPPVPQPGESSCEDRDGDGYGEGCAQGGDCDDNERSVHEGCAACVIPRDGCACDEGSKPVSCYREPSTADDGTVMCHEGTRYCRDRKWSSCESIVSYPRPDELETQAIVNPNAAPQHCNDCTINCYVVRDNLDPTTDAGLKSTSTNITTPKGGGVTLSSKVVDSGMGVIVPPPVLDPNNCMLGAAPDMDCDGIPDIYDPYPNDKPFGTANPALFYDIPAGKSGSNEVNLTFQLNSADVYFLIDQTASMDGESNQLKKDLTKGDFIQDAAYECADYDFDRKPNNELKAQGIVGAVRCLIREANFGVGLFREVPINYAPADNVTYRNYQDITADIPSVITAVNKLDVAGNVDWPEAAMLGLYAMATGEGFYFGPERTGLAPRRDCPTGTYGYPCFRNNAIPIVLMFTDAQLHNGPVNNDYPYVSKFLGFNAGSTKEHTPIKSTNETYENALDLGDVTNTNLTMIGDTRGMINDFDVEAVSCGNTDDRSPDAMFKFTVASTKTINASTWGSDFDTTLSIFKGAPTPTTNLPSYPNTNDTVATSYGFGTVNNKFVTASGDSTSLKHDYSANDVSCGAAATGKDATFTFNLSSATRVALSTRGSSYGTSLGLFSSAPATTTYASIVNTNDDITLASRYPVGTLNNRNRGYAGDTSAAAIGPNYSAKQLGCSGTALTATADANDAVYAFNLSQATKVRVSSEDSTLKSIIALTGDTGEYINIKAVTGNDTQTSAYDVGVLDDKAFQFTSSTASPIVSNYASTLTGCNSASSRDAVFKFTLNNSQTLDIDTTESLFDTSISLFRSVVGSGITTVNLPTSTTTNANTNEAATTAYDFGTLTDKLITTTGTSTNNMLADFSGAQIGCGANNNAPDSVFKFTLTKPTKVRVDTIGSAFDTVVSLHQNLPVQRTTAVAAKSNEAVDTAYAVTASHLSAGSLQSFTSSTSTMTEDVAINSSSTCTTDYAAKDAVFKVDVATAGNYELNTEGSVFDTVLGLYAGSPLPIRDAKPPTATPVAAPLGDKRIATLGLNNGAVDVGTINDRWVSYSGTTASGYVSDIAYTGCSAKASTFDVYFSFTVGLGLPRNVTIDTFGSGFDTVLALADGLGNVTDCNNDASGSTTDSQITKSLSTGTYYVFIKGRTTNGTYKINFRDTAVTDVSTTIACDDNSGANGVDAKMSRYLGVGTYYAVVKGRKTANSGAYRLNIKNLDALAATNRLACDSDSAGAGASQLDSPTLQAGEYFVIVKSTSAAAKGAYTLRVRDLLSLPGFVTCNDDGPTGKTSKITGQALTPGTYYTVVRGAGTANGAYTITFRDTDVQFTPLLGCDYNSGPSGTSLLERDLPAGNYRVIVKGMTAADKGPYKVSMRDLNGVPTHRLYCDGTTGPGGSSYIEQDLAAGSYTVVMQSSASSGAGGTYKLAVRDATKYPNPVATYCSNDITGSTTSKLSESLTAGTYYALVKGNKTADQGLYQFNIGGGGTTASTFSPPNYSQIRKALTDRQIKVLPVLSCRDDPAHGDAQGDCVATRTQATALANATGALGSNLQPLVYDIDGDGGGLSRTIVNGISEIAKYLEMNVSAQVVFEPDPNPGFILSIKAVDAPGDGCSGLVGAEHQRCAPGATPRFEITFTNPANKPVPNNPNDPYGGYNFRAELIGDNQYVMDKVPVYIMPHQVLPPPPKTVFLPSGSYWQDISATNCMGTQRPDWSDLTWNADIPDGTSVSFGVCGADNKADLGSCTPTALAKVTGGSVCLADSGCPNGYCSSKLNCQHVTAGNCTSDKDCTRGATCKTGVCRFTGQPIYIGDALKEKNYMNNMRMQIGLTSNPLVNTAPTVYDWSLNYFCNSAQ